MNTPILSYFLSMRKAIPAHFSFTERTFTTNALNDLIWKTHEYKQEYTLNEEDATLRTDIRKAFDHIDHPSTSIPVLSVCIQTYDEFSFCLPIPIYDEQSEAFTDRPSPYYKSKSSQESKDDKLASPAVCDDVQCDRGQDPLQLNLHSCKTIHRYDYEQYEAFRNHPGLCFKYEPSQKGEDDEMPSPSVCDYFAQHDQWARWQDIPDALSLITTERLNCLDPEGFQLLLPAQLCATLCLDSYSYWTSNIVDRLTLNPLDFNEKEDYPAFDDQQRDVILRYINRYRANLRMTSLRKLLPWECQLYLAQHEHKRVMHWLRARYPELGKQPAPPSVPSVERMRAAIPCAWSARDREKLEQFFDRLTQHLLSHLDERNTSWAREALPAGGQDLPPLFEPRRREPLSAETKDLPPHLDERNAPRKRDSLPAEEQDVLRRIDEAFADVSDEGCYRLLLASRAKDEFLEEHMQQFLSKHELRGDWRDIPIEWLSTCEWSLRHVDAVGYRFLLPAFLRASLLSDLAPDMCAKLKSNRDKDQLEHALEQSRLLNEQQREAVESYMHYFRCMMHSCYRLDYLLAWEMRDFLAQDEFYSASSWLNARYPVLWLWRRRRKILNESTWLP